MAWKEVRPMEERTKFVLLAERCHSKFTALCKAFDISRKTGYKWFNRYKEGGLESVREHSRRAVNCPHRTQHKVETFILKERRRHSTWGPKKIYQLIIDNGITSRAPSRTTVANILKRHGLTERRRRRPLGCLVSRNTLTLAERPNHVWAVDFKGWFRTQDSKICEPLTVSDLFSRYVLCCRALQNRSYEGVRVVFEKLFRILGLPEIIRVDNGSPFGSIGAAGLSRLSAWWISLGIRVEFIEPGHPEQNGSHERMHRTLKAETTRPSAKNVEAQKRRFDRWRREFNQERPHEAIDMQRPSQRYQRSMRRYCTKTEPPDYPGYYEVRRVKRNGDINCRGKRHVGQAFEGMYVGLKQAGECEYEAYFYDVLLGYLRVDEPGGLRPTASATQVQATKEENKENES